MAGPRRSWPRWRDIRRPAHISLFFVYSNNESFTSFQTLKDAAAGKGYRYTTEPVIPESGSFVVVPASEHETE